MSDNCLVFLLWHVNMHNTHTLHTHTTHTHTHYTHTHTHTTHTLHYTHTLHTHTHTHTHNEMVCCQLLTCCLQSSQACNHLRNLVPVLVSLNNALVHVSHHICDDGGIIFFLFQMHTMAFGSHKFLHRNEHLQNPQKTCSIW